MLAALDDRALAAELTPAWCAAARWLEGALDDGGGFVRYGTGAPRGSLSQHGWRDTTDPADSANAGGGILQPDGSAPAAPVADADCQAVAFAALRALARLSGQHAWSARAAQLAERVQASFGPDVMALDARDTPVPGAGSQLGWLLWSGVLGAGEAREAAADRLLASDVSTPFGLRTLSSSHRRFEPHAYHRGAVWPFDSWLGWGGLRAAGRAQGAQRVRHGVLAALDHLGRAPEFYAVTPNGGLESSPGANRVQAWTVGARWALEHEWDGRLRGGPVSASLAGE